MGGMNQTPFGERVHIAFFGRRNAGKSSLMNAFTGQEFSVVSAEKGTTTDVVYKAMELLPAGPVLLIDTPGLDDAGELGEKRIARARAVMRKADIAIVTADAREALGETERELLDFFEKQGIPCLLVWNKADLLEEVPKDGENTLWVSAKTGWKIHELKEHVAALLSERETKGPLIGDLLSEKDTVILVVPVDAGAPKGRLILPQQQVIRGILDAGAFGFVCRDTELEEALRKLSCPPKLVVTDSQVFDRVNRILPESVPLTSFSILMARYKGDLALLAKGAAALGRLQDGDRVLISEGCTHHRQCGDIGTVKLPAMIRRGTKKEPVFSFTSGTEFPEDVSSYKMVVHCGGCMLNRREMHYRLECCREQGVPVTNYGVLIAYLNGILERALEIFGGQELF
ncbi:MAG: [FeFe] hydrogenase H-cluster maturation GTPase HydF [Lachnospiraceae bacterium]|nr:[FeFe] hydrogenase H-cluster maturation GTPase HydF [Lachnospiraceae bacterium]